MLGGTTHAALYLWNGSAGDGLWETPGNWTVTDSAWTWPNEETGESYINSDVLGIDILNGDAVTRADSLRIKGADELTTAVLTLDTASSLSVSGRLSIGADPNDLPRIGELNVLNGSTLTILDGPNGNDLYVADDPNTVGTVNIVDSTVNTFDDINIDEGEGHVNISGNSTVSGDDIIAGNSATGVGYVDIGGTATINLDELKTNNGEGHITIGGNATLNLDDLMIDQITGVGTIDIGGSATITIADDILIDEAVGTINIGGTAVISNGDDFPVGDDPPGVGTATIGEDATVNVGDLLYVAHNDGSEGHLTISGNATVNIADDLIIANAGGVTATLHITGNPTINIAEQFYMNDDEGAPANSQTIMDGGTVTVNSYTTFNDDNPGTAEFIMNGGSFYSADYLNLSDNLDGTAHLTMNGGEMITGNRLRLGKDGGEDTGQVRIFLNGGLLQAEGLNIKITDTKIIHTGGVLRISSASVSEDDIWQMIADGTIVADCNDYIVATDGAYTILSEPPVKAWAPNPVDGAIGMSTTPRITTYISDDVPKDIPDWSWTTKENILGEVISILNVPDSRTIRDLNVELDIKKSGNDADLNVYLKSPDGKQVELFTDVGYNKKHFKNTILDDEASTSINNGTAPFTGIYKPEGKLSAFDGRNTKGNWQLKIQDDWPAGGSGTLNSWRVVIESPILLSWKPGANAVSQEVYFSDKFDEVNDSSGKALLGSIAGDATSIEGKALKLSTTYYWCVNSIQADGTVLSGDIWSFSTALGNIAIDQKVLSGNDDGEDHIAYGEAADDGAEGRDSTDLEMPWEGDVGSSSYQVIGLRFADMMVPKGMQIIRAFVQFTGDNNDNDKLVGGPVNLIINGLLQSDTNELGDGENFSEREPKTAAEVSWTDIPEWTSGQATVESRTPDITNIVEEITGQDSWAQGNALMLFLRDDETNPSAAARSALAVDESTAVAPVLHIDAISEAAGNPSPANEAIDVVQDTIVSWEPGFNTVSSDVYFGTKSSPASVGTTTGISYDPGKLTVSTTYYWRVDETDADGNKHTGPVWSFTAVIGEATEPEPADGATGVALDATLSWKAGATAKTHDVYLGRTSPPEFVGNQEDTNFDPGALRVGATYYWQIDEIEADGTRHIGDVWSFATISGQATQPDPADGAVIEQTYALLTWAAGISAVSHNVYIGDNLDDVTNGVDSTFIGNLDVTVLSVGLPDLPFPDGLVPGTTYYWRVDEVEADGTTHAGQIWSFSIPPETAYNPNPADGATVVDINVQLSWTAGLGAKLHSVYFGDDLDTVNNATGAPPLPSTTFNPGTLEPGKTYYWRVDELNPPNTIKGEVWSFTTG